MGQLLPPPPVTRYAPISGDLFREEVWPYLGVGSAARRYHLPREIGPRVGLACRCGREVILERETLFVAGWLRVEYWIGKCPACRVWLWG